MGDLLAIKKSNFIHRSIDMTVMLDDKLSLQAKGLHYYLQTRPDEWKIWFSNLIKFSTNGETSVRSALNELVTFGYLVRVQLRNEKKQVIRMLYVSLEKPGSFSDLDLKNLDLENLNVGIKVHSYNIYSNKNILLSKDNIEVLEPPSSSNYSSRDKKQASTPKLKNMFLLEEWRLKEITPKKQHHTKEGTKIQTHINFLTTLLLKGKFGEHCDLSDDFLKSCNLTKVKTNRKYSKDELLAGLDEMAEMFKQNNLPEDKTAISKMSFDALIYHPVAKMSYLLKYLWSDTKPLAYKTIEVYVHWLDKLYEERIFDQDIEKDNHQFGILKKGLAGIEEYYAWIISNIRTASSSLMSTEDNFFNTYLGWLQDNWNAVTPYGIGPQANTWYQFIKWLEEAIHGDFKHQYPTLDRRKIK